MMRGRFFKLVECLSAGLSGNEVLLANLSAEDSVFVRFNRSLVRQPGTVHQEYCALTLIDGQRQAGGSITLTGDRAEDLAAAKRTLSRLRELLPQLPEDPYMLYNTEIRNTTRCGEDRLPDAADAVARILEAGKGLDMVGIHAQGGIHRGFANSLGQQNWFSSSTFHFDWTLYHAEDKAVKATYAGFEWDDAEFDARMTRAKERLAILRQPARTIPPGTCRAYLSPAALGEFVGLLGWGGFGIKSHRTRQSPLLRMAAEGATLSPMVTLVENSKDGLAPGFEEKGFVRPEKVPLIERGRQAGFLVSPRSGKEYGMEPNAGGEGPTSLEMAAGTLPRDKALSELDTGVLINTLWYLNYSDRPGGRITGMTRFATFWVEHGQIVAPINVMRFDETVYRALGENLRELTREREFLPSDSTYGGRAVASQRMPGALIDDFRFTL